MMLLGTHNRLGIALFFQKIVFRAVGSRGGIHALRGLDFAGCWLKGLGLQGFWFEG